MSSDRFSALAAIALMICLPLTVARADSVVSVKLTDNGVTMDLSKSMGLGIGMKADMTKASMSIDINPRSVLRGKVKFNVTNSSSKVIHEMIVSPIADESKPLTYVDAENRVNEEASINLGEVSELDPGKSGALVIDVKPGKYILYCNLPGHYMSGMWTVLEVR